VSKVSTLLREYVWFEGKPVAVVEGGVVYFVRSDHIGRPVFATDGTGAKVWEATYLPFGGVHTSSGSPIALRFPGQWFPSESGLHQNWMRDYDPTTGRYIQADPLGLVDGASVYGYAGQNPGRYVDSRGLSIQIAKPFVPHMPSDDLLQCAGDDDYYCRNLYEELIDEFDSLLMGGYGKGVRDAYNAAADAYNERCAYPGSNRPKLPLLPFFPPSSGGAPMSPTTINSFLTILGGLLLILSGPFGAVAQ